MIITLEPNQSVEIRFAHGRDQHGEPLLSDGTISVSYDDREKFIRVHASDPDTQGRSGVIYEENFSNPPLPASVTKEQDIFKMARAIIAEHLQISPESISMESDIMSDIGADSLDLIELVMAFEVQYGLSIPDEDVDDIVSVNDIVQYLAKRL
jgi:acyl carrier protein